MARKKPDNPDNSDLPEEPNDSNENSTPDSSPPNDKKKQKSYKDSSDSNETDEILNRDLNSPPSFLRPEYEHTNDKEVEVRVQGVFEHVEPGFTQRFVLLRDSESRTVPIIIGPFEALAISIVLENEKPYRPFTHDLMKAVIDKLGGTLERVVIDDLWHDVFYAKLYINKNGEQIEIDSRPSDAIALALRFKAPIFMADCVLDATRQEE